MYRPTRPECSVCIQIKKEKPDCEACGKVIPSINNVDAVILIDNYLNTFIKADGTIDGTAIKTAIEMSHVEPEEYDLVYRKIVIFCTNVIKILKDKI